MRRAFATLLLLLCATCCTSAQAAEEGIKYTSPEGRYSVRLPKEPKLSAQETAAPTGLKFKQFSAFAFDGKVAHSVTYYDYGADVVFTLDKARDGILSRVNGTLLSGRAVALGVYPGVEFSVEAKNAGGLEISARQRLYDVEQRIYHLQCVTAKAIAGPEFARKCDKFFDSFKVEPAK